MNSDLINALIAAATSLAVVVLSQFLIHIKDRSQLREKEMDAVLKECFNPIRFMLSENYFRISRIVSEVKREGNTKKLLTVNHASEIAGKEDEWFCREGCYLVSSAYLLACMFSYIDNIRTKLSFFRLPHNTDTELIRLINKLTAEFSRGGIYYVIQMDMEKRFRRRNRRIVLQGVLHAFEERAGSDMVQLNYRFFPQAGTGQVSGG